MRSLNRKFYGMLVAVFCLAITITLMVSAYKSGKADGRELGRVETIQLINEDLEHLNINVGNWNRTVKYGTSFNGPGELWDDCLETKFEGNKLSFSYEHH